MARVRSLKDMKKKYELKYDGTNVTTAITAVKDIMESRYEGAVSTIYNVVETVRNILSEEGVPSGLWAPYIAFGEELAKETFSHSGLTLQKIASGLKNQYITIHGCDPNVLDRIIEAIIGTVPPY